MTPTLEVHTQWKIERQLTDKMHMANSDVSIIMAKIVHTKPIIKYLGISHHDISSRLICGR